MKFNKYFANLSAFTSWINIHTTVLNVEVKILSVF